MIISKKYQFIFLHSRKCAGSSIKVSLAPHLGPEDFVIGSHNEILDYGYKLPINQQRSLDKNACFQLTKKYFSFFKDKSPSRSQNSAAKMLYTFKYGKNPPHLTANQVKKFFPYEWSAYKKLCIVRNPYTMVVSDYNWRCRAKKIYDISFLDYLSILISKKNKHNFAHEPIITNWDIYTIDNRINVDYIVKFENLESGIKNILSKNFGIYLESLPREVKMTNYKQFTQQSMASQYFSEYYTSRKALDLVYEIFYNEIDYFNYVPPVD